ncbi:MAG: hypothetical protein PVG79_04255, partial [Gemmatimonadales bacterium]
DGAGVEMRGGTVVADERTLLTKRPGVFAGGDLATGSNTVIAAIAAGWRAAEVIDRYLRGRELYQAAEPRLPRAYVEPVVIEEDAQFPVPRVKAPKAPTALRVHNFDEVEATVTVEDAAREARRCLRCDLEFTERLQGADELRKAGGGDR